MLGGSGGLSSAAGASATPGLSVGASAAVAAEAPGGPPASASIGTDALDGAAQGAEVTVALLPPPLVSLVQDFVGRPQVWLCLVVALVSARVT